MYAEHERALHALERLEALAPGVSRLRHAPIGPLFCAVLLKFDNLL